jgi:hypothetical protein
MVCHPATTSWSIQNFKAQSSKLNCKAQLLKAQLLKAQLHSTAKLNCSKLNCKAQLQVWGVWWQMQNRTRASAEELRRFATEGSSYFTAAIDERVNRARIAQAERVAEEATTVALSAVKSAVDLLRNNNRWLRNINDLLLNATFMHWRAQDIIYHVACAAITPV